MKKVNKIILISILIIISIITLSSCTKTIDTEEIIRIHIRANSNSDLDQSVKYMVKDEIVNFINPLSQGVENKEGMYLLLQDNLPKMKEIADDVLKAQGMEYEANVILRSEEFPVRSYDNVTLPAGIYDALIIELGEAEGNNWWCVAFPPLCFIGAEDNGEDYFTYKSKLLEILNKG